MKFLNFLRPSDAVQENRVIAGWSVASAVFFVTALWGLDPGRLGLNAAIYLLAVFGLFLWTLRRRGRSLAANAYWIAPGLLLVASYTLYTNPFLKTINNLVLPAALAVFYGLAHLPPGQPYRWSGSFIIASVKRFFSPLAKINEAGRLFENVRRGSGTGKGIMRSVVIGSVIMLVVVFAVVLPLLMAADAAFASLMESFLARFSDLFEPVTVAKIICAALLSLITVAALIGWGRAPSAPSDDAAEKPTDSIIAGIVLGGILLAYLLFLGLQAKKLLVGQLPFSFAETVYTVKSGFWQLIALSALNVALFVIAYRRTIPAVQRLLGVFTAASLLLLASAAQRMALYVTYYGFSYEKFYACLAVLFCAGVFGYLTWCLVRRERADVLRFASLLFVWMYAVAAVFPTEQFIWRANVALAGLPGSHVRLYELTMLSTDVLGPVQESFDDGTLLTNGRATIQNSAGRSDEQIMDGWRGWIEGSREELTQKSWHQMNLSDVFSLMDIVGR
jgi:hypothetical protein